MLREVGFKVGTPSRKDFGVRMRELAADDPVLASLAGSLLARCRDNDPGERAADQIRGGNMQAADDCAGRRSADGVGRSVRRATSRTAFEGRAMSGRILA